LIRRHIAALAASAPFFAAPAPSMAATHHAERSSLATFATEAARAHGPHDAVVRSSGNRGIGRERVRWYGRTEHAYVDRREADAAGDRDTRNGR